MNLLANPILQIILLPIRQWLESIKVNNYKKAHTLCQLIPASCPFERNITLFKRTILHIPPLCKLNPFYEQLVELRFKALTYLAESGEDVTIYC
ncbi:Mo-dependent nitrogenase-like [Rivularia sp. IAM M-261]|nr:Mo-dependent nitrogenase-like [Calothrix sp. PCC 7716]GJD20030.1 Mo-dependent nitrogenase-like [Rivularia sp. IAM M-261]